MSTNVRKEHFDCVVAAAEASLSDVWELPDYVLEDMKTAADFAQVVQFEQTTFSRYGLPKKKTS